MHVDCGLPAPPSMPQSAARSELFGRLEAFMPTMKAANDDLQAQHAADPASVDIEQVDEDGQHIEMDLHCGVFQEQPEGADGEVRLRPVPSDSDSSDDEPEVSLQLPPQQTAAVAAATKAGRPLISLVDEEGESCEPEGGPEGSAAVVGVCKRSGSPDPEI